MKKVVLISILLLISTNIFSEEKIKYDEFREFFYSWGVDVELFASYNEDLTTIYIDNNKSKSWLDARNDLATIMFSIMDEALYLDTDIEDLGYDQIIYRWIGAGNTHIILDLDWIEEYFEEERDKDKAQMITDVMNEIR